MEDVQLDKIIQAMLQSIAELRESQAKTDLQIQKISRKLDKVGKRLESIGINMGDFAWGNTTLLRSLKMMKYNHVGIPTKENFEGEIDLPKLQMTVSDHENNPFGIQWQRYWENAPYPDLVKSVPHVAFEVDDMNAALKNQKVIIAPNSPSEGLTVAFIEVNGVPVELMHYE